MSATGSDIVRIALGDELVKHMEGTEAGHCVRVDDIEAQLALELTPSLQDELGSVADVFVLRAKPGGGFEIAPERAIELRNRKAKALLLLVPPGEGHAASSLDNSFERLQAISLYAGAESAVRDQIAQESVRALASRQASRLGKQKEPWLEFLGELVVDPTFEAFGKNLWRIGLIPDLGADVETRLDRNRRTASAISQPSRPAASIDERLTIAGLEEGAWRAPLRQYLDQAGARLANPRIWTEALQDQGLSFENWRLADAVHHHLTALEIDPFVKPDGTLDKSSKLKLGSDDQLVLEVPEGGAAPLVVKWKTNPNRVDTIAKWRIEVRKPEDLRDDESEPLVETKVNGALRRSTVKVEVSADDLDSGTLFVVSVTPLGQHGEEIALESGEPAFADSQWFQIAIKDAPDVKTLRRAAVSVPEAALQAAMAGQDDLTEDLVMWDLDGQVFGLRLGNRRSIQVRVSDTLVRLQRDAVSSPNSPKHYLFRGVYGTRLEDKGTSDSPDLVLPKALAKARADFLGALGADSSRNTGESVTWTDELRSMAKGYTASFKRALEQASGEALRHLLLMDSASVQVKRANNWVRAVILLPIHPLRLGWIADHDAVLRRWAREITEVKPNSARASHLDIELVKQVVPANLPFTVTDADGNIAVYSEELTYGSGLYIVPGSMDRDSAAEAICSVLDLERMSTTMRASSTLVAERIAAYEQAHRPGEALRLLAVNPGSGDLVAGALATDVQVDLIEEEEDVEPHRLEIVAYSDSAAYVEPVPALIRLQEVLRARNTSKHVTHLSPAMSLSVRGLLEVSRDTASAHLAIVQDVYEPMVGFTEPSERKPSFHDLLVPIVTVADQADGTAKRWVSSPTLGPAAGGGESELSVVHRTHQRAIAKFTGAPEGSVPTVTVVLNEDRQTLVRKAHERADWVIGLDRYIGVDLFGSGVVDTQYILDYAPDFVEGIGDRLTVTTTHRQEVEQLLDSAMDELGLAWVDQSVGRALETLSLVSGRLALRLLKDTTRAREAVSLAALVVYLQSRGQLEDLIVVPVDAHLEIFGAALRDSGEARRCDLLLVRIGPRSFKIECVEVKSRKEAHLPQALADHIVNQVEDTKRMLESRFFSDPPRIDSELQRARLTSLLHYYADRAFANGIIAPDRIGDIHRHIDRVNENGEQAVITTQGYVISLDGDKGFKKKYGDTPMAVITASDLVNVGLTTRAARIDLGSVAPWEESDVVAVEASDVVVPAADVSAEAELVESQFSQASPPAAGSVTVPAEPEPRDAEPSAQGGPKSSSESDLADENTNEVVVSLGEDSGGSTVSWRVSTKGSPHAFILGIPGQGKSVTTRKILRDFVVGGLPSLVFDFHGDMAVSPPEGAAILDAALGLPFNPFEPDVQAGRPINMNAMEIAEILAHVASLGDIQRDHVYTALQQAYEEHGWNGLERGASTPGIEDFVSALGNVESKQAGKNAVARLRAFTDFGLFAPGDHAKFDILTADKRGLVVDISKLTEEVQRVAASFILRKVYREMFRWNQDGTMKLAVVLDEAHRMARDVTLPKIMKEGRKYGAGVIVASQNVDDFHSDVLGNAGTKIVFRTNYPASKKVSNFLRGRTGVDISQEIEKLNVGVAYVSTPDVAQARKVYMSQ